MNTKTLFNYEFSDKVDRIWFAVTVYIMEGLINMTTIQHAINRIILFLVGILLYTLLPTMSETAFTLFLTGMFFGLCGLDIITNRYPSLNLGYPIHFTGVILTTAIIMGIFTCFCYMNSKARQNI